MINTREDLKKYLEADAKANNFGNSIKELLTYNDAYLVHSLLRALRKVEYYKNNRKGLNILAYIWHLWNFRRLIVKTNIMIFPNTAGPGLNLVHSGFRRIDRFVKLGKNCTILPMVLFGRKRPTDIDSEIIVGNDCYISTGVTILGPVKIGNNVTIGAGAVVNKDIPDNAVVGGVPAKLIKYKK